MGQYELKALRPECLVAAALRELLGQQIWEACRSGKTMLSLLRASPTGEEQCPGWPKGTSLQLLGGPRLGPSKWLA